MSKHKKYVPKHRAPVASAPKRAIRNTVVLSSVAAAATGVAVGGGMVGQADGPRGDLTAAAASFGTSTGTAPDAEAVEARRAATPVSRSDRRTEAPSNAEPALLSESTRGNAVTRTEDHSDEDPKQIAKVLLAEFGFGSDQFSCLDQLWTRESNWRWNADNPTSSAYGIPQALPGSKMASAGADWATNPVTQIRWGLGYIKGRYGTPCSAWAHSESHNWY